MLKRGDKKYEKCWILRRFTVYFDPDGIYTKSKQINSSKKILGNEYFNFNFL